MDHTATQPYPLLAPTPPASLALRAIELQPDRGLHTRCRAPPWTPPPLAQPSPTMTAASACRACSISVVELQHGRGLRRARHGAPRAPPAAMVPPHPPPPPRACS
ncbi:hypothetical protein SEVIR_1G263801v4 [Setaria viridis]